MAEGQAAGRELDEPPPATPLNPPRPWYQKARWQITTVAVVVILTAGLFWWCPWCTVRVTDGSELLADNLDKVQKLILAENDRVTNSGQEWVSIAVMQPIHPADEPNAPTRIVHQLQGSYLAQYWFNHPGGGNEFGSDRPLIKLLIADTGLRGEDWQDTVAQLVDLASPGSDEHLVAVTGLDQSTTNTQAAVNELARHEIPIIGSAITATDLTARGLFRVSPSNSDEAAAMIQYLQKTEEWKSASVDKPYNAYLIQDRDSTNTYAKDLGDQYRQAFPRDDPTHILSNLPGEFNGGKPGAGNPLAGHVSTICANDHKVVFFAGRSGDLRTFLGKLAARPQPCADTPIMVVTGDDVSDLNNPYEVGQLWTDKGTNITVYYTALTSPQMWGEKYQKYVSAATVTRFRECPNCYSTLFPGDILDDGQAIMSHDAVLTAAIAAGNVRSQQDSRLMPGALINGLYKINSTGKVSGASGYIDFQYVEGRPAGVPYNKVMPIMKLLSNGGATLVDLSSRLGTPPQ